MMLTGWDFPPAFTAGLTLLCAIFWITEVIPIPVTAFLPLTLLPLSGVLDQGDVIKAYGHPVHFLLLGGFILSLAISNSNVHLRIATGIMSRIPNLNGSRVVIVFILISATLSLWITNIAVALMLLPIALAVLDKAEDKQMLTAPLLLGICYAASIGGMGTPIGTPANLVFMSVYEQHSGQAFSFLQWMSWTIPVVITLLAILSWRLTRTLKASATLSINRQGPWQAAEKRILWLYAVTILAWVFRSDPYGGWSEWLNMPNAHDGYVALLASLATFIIPAGNGKKLMDWEAATKIPWGILILIAGGLALSIAMKKTHLVDSFASQFETLVDIPFFLLVLIICLSVTFLTELMSNTASAALLMPIFAVSASAMHIDPIVIMMPAVLSTSCAFMLPMATGPNAVVFASGRIEINDMLRQGLILNFLCALALTLIII